MGEKAVLLSFRLEDNAVMPAGGFTQFTTKYRPGIRELHRRPISQPGGSASFSANGGGTWFIHRQNVVLMPSYVNIGAYVDEGTMVDLGDRLKSCAQIGKNVHLSGGVGIGGVLEPMQITQPSSATTASSARAPKSSKA